MIRLSRRDQWFPERIAGLVAEIGRDQIDLCVFVDADNVRGEFPHVNGRVQLPEIRDWLTYVARSAAAYPGPNLDGWASSTAAKIVQFANSKLARPDAFR